MSKGQGKKAVAIIGLAALGAGTLALLATAKAEGAGTPVQLLSNPIPTTIFIDGQQVNTPAQITVSKGNHTFVAPTKSPGMTITYGFDRWTINGQAVSYNASATIRIDGACTIKAEYMIAESGIYPVAINSTSSPPHN